MDVGSGNFPGKAEYQQNYVGNTFTASAEGEVSTNKHFRSGTTIIGAGQQLPKGTKQSAM